MMKVQIWHWASSMNQMLAKQSELYLFYENLQRHKVHWTTLFWIRKIIERIHQLRMKYNNPILLLINHYKAADRKTSQNSIWLRRWEKKIEWGLPNYSNSKERYNGNWRSSLMKSFQITTPIWTTSTHLK